jgi:hypothetical protein
MRSGKPPTAFGHHVARTRQHRAAAQLRLPQPTPDIATASLPPPLQAEQSQLRLPQPTPDELWFRRWLSWLDRSTEMLWPWLGGTEPCSTWLSRNITRFHYDWLSDTNPWSVLLARPMACQVTRAGRGSPNFAVRRWVLARRQVRPFLGRAWVTELHNFTVESYPSDHAAKGRKAAPRHQEIIPIPTIVS